MYKTRRTFLKASMAAGTIAIATGAGLLTPRTALAAWPKKAFKASKVDEALNALAGSSSTTLSKDITIEAPDIAENGAVVSIKVKSNLPKIESISILVAANGAPLAASYILSSRTDGYIAGRIKMRKTSDVIAVVKADGKLHMAKKAVKVTLGGCGG